ncbi:MAG TPA: hypothetical protein DCL38_10900 [Lachnospiraceae bacterium]|nr:hypothetical protein [Lachnospiraceae bacterium]
MTTYIALISDGKLRDVLKKMKKEDSLIVFYNEKEKQIPIDMIGLFSEKQGQFSFRECSDDISIAFETGQLYGEISSRNNAKLEIVSDSKLFGELRKRMGEQVRKPAGKRNTAKKPEASEPEQLSFNINSPEKQDGKAKTSRRKNTDNIKEDAAKDDLFEKAYNNFDALLLSLRSKDYDPGTQKQGILNALKLVAEEGTDLESAMEKTLTPAEKKKFFKEMKPEDIAAIQNAGLDVIKYD